MDKLQQLLDEVNRQIVEQTRNLGGNADVVFPSWLIEITQERPIVYSQDIKPEQEKHYRRGNTLMW